MKHHYVGQFLIDYFKYNIDMFQVGVYDGVHDGRATTVRIQVQDINDNAPEFNETSYQFNVPEVSDSS